VFTQQQQQQQQKSCLQKMTAKKRGAGKISYYD